MHALTERLLSRSYPNCTVMAYLLFGGTGWIGGMLTKLLQDAGETVIIAQCRLENREALERELDEHKPKYVLNAAGVTGRPNVDWCESHKGDTIKANVIGALNLADVCWRRNLPVTVFATGCIYEYDEAHPWGGPGFTEEDPPNFHGSFYSHTKGYVEDMMKSYPNVLILRVRLPIADELSPRNLITKITTYAKVVNIPNSVTILPDLLPIAIEMTKRGLAGVYNFTNPGAISHNEVLELYKEHVDPSFTWVNFTLEEQDQITVAKRSNNLLDTTKLEKEFPDVPPVKASMVQVMKRMRALLDAQKAAE